MFDPATVPRCVTRSGRLTSPVWSYLLLAARHGAPARYAPRAALYLLKLAAFEPFRLLEWALRPRGPCALPHPPLFVLGYYRSGTTHLQEAMLQDPRFGYLNFYQGFFPTAFNTTEPWLRPVFERIIRASGFLHPAHQIPFSFALPCEDDIALLASASPYAANLGQMFPGDFRSLFGRFSLLEGATPEELAGLLEAVHDLLLRATAANGGQRQLLLKSPPHTGRMALLRHQYPGARFVFIHRNPRDVFASNLRLWKTFEMHHMAAVTPEQVRDNILWSYDGCLSNYMRDRAQMPPGSLCELRFDDLMADPLGCVARVYEELELGGFEDVAPRMAAWLARSHRAPKAYTLSPEDRRQVEARLGRWITLWGYGAG